MSRFPILNAFAATALCAGLAACSGTASIQTLPVSPANAYLLTSEDAIVGIDLDSLQFARSVRKLPRATTATPVDGFLDLDEVVLDIDYRNSEGALYALTRTGTTGRLIRIDPSTGSFVRVSTLVVDGGNTPMTLPDVAYTIDFNPVVDRLRIIGSNGSNWRTDVLTGDTLTDMPITGNTITGAAYEDTFAPGGRSTRLFTLDAGTDSLYLQSPPNNGTQTGQRPLLTGTDFTSVDGFDINPSNQAGVAMLTRNGEQRLFQITQSGTGDAASPLGAPPALNNGARYKALTLITAANPTVLALSSNNQLYSFNAADPGTLSTALAINGLTAPEKIIGIDLRQSDRKLYALSDASKLYTLDVNTGATTAVSTLSTPLTASVSYTMDFNPLIASTGTASNRLRLIGDDDSNAIVEVETGTVTASTPISGTPDPIVVAAAYSGNYRGSTSTSLLVIDRANAALSEQTITPSTSNPVLGVLTRISELGIMLAGHAGFDISGRLSDNILIMAHAAEPGSSTLYRVNSNNSSELAPLGVIGGNTGPQDLIDIAIRF